MSRAKLARKKSTPNLNNNLLPRVTLIQKPSENILCLICKKVLRNPQQLSCGHARVCQICYENSILKQDDVITCPVDGEEITRVFPDNSALIDIMNSDCYCLGNLDGCNWKGLVMDLEDHFNSCPFCTETPCPYKDFRCNFVGTHSHLKEHLKEDITQHDILTAISVYECMRYVRESNSILNHIKENTAVLDSNTVNIYNEMQDLEIHFRRMTNIVEAIGEKESARLHQCADDLQKNVSWNEEKKSKLLSFYNRFDDLVKKVEKQMSHIDSNMKKTEGDKKVPIAEKLKRLSDSTEQHNKLVNGLSTKFRIAQCSDRHGNYTWKLDNLRARLSEAQKGRTRELYTPPLYTSQFGYKYSAKVMLASEKDKGNSNYMGFYLLLMQGDYDEILHFPFPYPIEVTLINFSNNHPNIIKTLYPDPRKAHFEKPYKNMNPAIGFAKFITMDKLKSENFIKNDTIYFKITVQKNGINVKEPNI